MCVDLSVWNNLNHSVVLLVLFHTFALVVWIFSFFMMFLLMMPISDFFELIRLQVGLSMNLTNKDDYSLKSDLL